MHKLFSILVIAGGCLLLLASCVTPEAELPKDAKIEYLGECGWKGKRAYVVSTHQTSKVKARVEISWLEGDKVKTIQEVYKLFPEQALFIRCTLGGADSGTPYSFRVASTVSTGKYFY